MNTCFKKRGTASRLFSWVMALALVLSLVAAPALTASADSDTYSAELIFSAEGMDISGKITLDTNQLLLAVAARMAAGNEVLADAAAYLSAQALAVDSNFLGGAYGVACAYATILIIITYAAIVLMNWVIRHFGTSKAVRLKED